MTDVSRHFVCDVLTRVNPDLSFVNRSRRKQNMSIWTAAESLVIVLMSWPVEGHTQSSQDSTIIGKLASWRFL